MLNPLNLRYISWNSTGHINLGSLTKSIIVFTGAEYNILGESVSVAGYKDINLAVIIAQINILGKDYYDWIKQGYILWRERKYFKRKFKEIERDRKDRFDYKRLVFIYSYMHLFQNSSFF
jgi:hypothetical protein